MVKEERLENRSSERPIILKLGNKIIFILDADKRGKGGLKLLLWSEITPNGILT